MVNEAICKGCGTCTSACPAGAIMSKHFTKEQILAQIEGILSSEQTYLDVELEKAHA
jgi:heterodisulfide reductase subunit A